MPLAAVAVVAAAGRRGRGSSGGTTTVTESAGGNPSNSKVLVGAGSTFVPHSLSQWEADYVKSPAAVTITYGAIGSGGGVDQITARTVDFGASDAPLSSDQATACKGCIQIPWSLGAAVDHLQRQGRREQDPSDRPGHRRDLHGQDHVVERPGDRQAEPGRQPPRHAITPVYRSDGSGTASPSPSWLTDVSPDWANSVGTSTQPPFPTGTGAEKHSSGVVAAVEATDGALTTSTWHTCRRTTCSMRCSRTPRASIPEPGVTSVTAAAKAGTTIARRIDLARESARVCGGRLPRCDIHVRRSSRRTLPRPRR